MIKTDFILGSVQRPLWVTFRRTTVYQPNGCLRTATRWLDGDLLDIH